MKNLRKRKNATAFIETDLSIVAVISRAFFTFLKRPFLYLAFGALSLLPTTLIGAIAPQTSGSYLGNFVNLLCGAIISAAIAFVVYQSSLGKEIRLGEALSEGLKAFNNLAILALLINIITFLGLMMLIFPGVIIACMCAAAIPACVIEGLTPTESVLRSLNLSDGQRLKIFVILLIYAAVFILLSVNGQKVSASVSANATVQALILNLFLVIPLAFQGIINALIYLDLLVIKDGVSLDKLPNYFD